MCNKIVFKPITGAFSGKIIALQMWHKDAVLENIDKLHEISYYLEEHFPALEHSLEHYEWPFYYVHPEKGEILLGAYEGTILDDLEAYTNLTMF